MRDCMSINLNGNETSSSPITNVAFRPDGRVIATDGPKGNMITFWGIPETESISEGANPTVSICPSIPMIVENPIPKCDWFGGGRPFGG
jgi:hypothetical protein